MTKPKAHICRPATGEDAACAPNLAPSGKGWGEEGKGDG
jgi:hypothetical protein